MRTHRLTLFLFLLLIIPCNIFSQEVFREGYIIRNNGEIVTGLIGFNPDVKSPSSCLFIKFDIAVVIPYSPGEIKAFGYFNGQRFETLKTGEKYSFFETLVTGEINLFRKGSRYYIQKGESVPVAVKEGSNSWDYNGEKSEFKTLAEFIRYLTSDSEISDKMSLSDDLPEIIAEFNRKSKKPWNNYNNDISEREYNQLAWKSGAGRKRYGIITGLNIYNSVSIANDKSYVPGSDLQGSIMIGVSYEKTISKKNDRLSLVADLIYSKHKFQSFSLSKIYDYTVQNDAFFEFSGIKLPVLLNYSITGKKVMPFINIGFSGTFLLNKKYLHISEWENGLKNVRIDEDSDLPLKSYEICPVAGAGIKTRLFGFKTLNLEGRVEYGSGLFNVPELRKSSFKQHSFQASFIMGIKF